jgi:hypothetical protein
MHRVIETACGKRSIVVERRQHDDKAARCLVSDVDEARLIGCDGDAVAVRQQALLIPVDEDDAGVYRLAGFAALVLLGAAGVRDDGAIGSDESMNLHLMTPENENGLM